MSEQCNHDCSNCSENCAERDPKSFLKAPHKNSNIKKVIAVVSGKGGVGKSLVTYHQLSQTDANTIQLF